MPVRLSLKYRAPKRRIPQRVTRARNQSRTPPYLQTDHIGRILETTHLLHSGACSDTFRRMNFGYSARRPIHGNAPARVARTATVEDLVADTH